MDQDNLQKLVLRLGRVVDELKHRFDEIDGVRYELGENVGLESAKEVNPTDEALKRLEKMMLKMEENYEALSSNGTQEKAAQEDDLYENVGSVHRVVPRKKRHFNGAKTQRLQRVQKRATTKVARMTSSETELGIQKKRNQNDTFMKADDPQFMPASKAKTEVAEPENNVISLSKAREKPNNPRRKNAPKGKFQSAVSAPQKLASNTSTSSKNTALLEDDILELTNPINK